MFWIELFRWLPGIMQHGARTPAFRVWSFFGRGVDKNEGRSQLFWSVQILDVVIQITNEFKQFYEVF